MVTLETSHKELNKCVGKNLKLKELEETLFDMGYELDKVEGDELKIDITAERPDLLSTQGIARAIKSYLGLKVEDYKIKKSNDKLIVKDTAKEWPYAIACIVKGLKFDEEKIKEVIRIQEKLGATFLRKRKKGGLGLYELKNIKFPVTFTSLDPKKIKFRPLEYPKEINGLEVLEKHPTGQKYKHLMEAKERGVGLWNKFPVFIDANNKILSMPPIINSHDFGKISNSTTDVFVEGTGTDLKTINLALEVLVGALIDMGGVCYSIDVVYDKEKFVVPSFKEEKRTIKVDYVNKILGLNLESKDIKKYLEKMGYKISSLNEKVLQIVVPGTRSDIWHDIDVVDDIARAYGFNNFELNIKPVATTGSTTSDVLVKEDVSKLMIGLEYQEVFTLILSSKEDQFENMNIKEIPHIKLSTSVEQSLNIARVWLLPELMKCLRNNRSVEYPHKLFEINYVIHPDSSKDVLSRDVFKLSSVSCHSGANFTEVKQLLDYLMNCLGLNYSIKEAEHGSFISGRVGKVIRSE